MGDGRCCRTATRANPARERRDGGSLPPQAVGVTAAVAGAATSRRLVPNGSSKPPRGRASVAPEWGTKIEGEVHLQLATTEAKSLYAPRTRGKVLRIDSRAGKVHFDARSRMSSRSRSAPTVVFCGNTQGESLCIDRRGEAWW